MQTSPMRIAVRDLLLCLAICGVVVVVDIGALTNPVRFAVMAMVVVGVPVVNYLAYRRRVRTED